MTSELAWLIKSHLIQAHPWVETSLFLVLFFPCFQVLKIMYQRMCPWWPILPQNGHLASPAGMSLVATSLKESATKGLFHGQIAGSLAFKNQVSSIELEWGFSNQF